MSKESASTVTPTAYLEDDKVAERLVGEGSSDRFVGCG